MLARASTRVLAPPDRCFGHRVGAVRRAGLLSPATDAVGRRRRALPKSKRMRLHLYWMRLEHSEVGTLSRWTHRDDAFGRREAHGGFSTAASDRPLRISALGPSQSPWMAGHHFGNLIQWLSGKGDREDPEARAGRSGSTRDRLLASTGDTAADMLRARMIEEHMIEPVTQVAAWRLPGALLAYRGPGNHFRPPSPEASGVSLGSACRLAPARSALSFRRMSCSWCRGITDAAPEFTQRWCRCSQPTTVRSVGHTPPLHGRYSMSSREDVLQAVGATFIRILALADGVFRSIRSASVEASDVHPSARDGAGPG